MATDVVAVLAGPQADAFRSFVDKNLASENLMFFEAVVAYKQLKDEEERRAAAKSIVSKFFDSGSEFEINVDFSIRQNIEKNVEKAQGTLFDDAHAEIVHLLNFDLIPKFRHSAAASKPAQQSQQPPTQPSANQTTPSATAASVAPEKSSSSAISASVPIVAAAIVGVAIIALARRFRSK